MYRISLSIRWSVIMSLAMCSVSRVHTKPFMEDVEQTTTVQTTYSKWLKPFNCSSSLEKSNSPSNGELKEIRLINCSIPELHANMFKEFGSIQSLTIRNSKLLTMDKMSLFGLRQLQSLAITFNHLTVLDRWSPHYFNTLETLNFQSNDISELFNDALHPYPNLQKLSLSHNRITQLPREFFVNTSRLRSIDLSHNRLTHIPLDQFAMLHQLSDLSLSYNEITFLNSTIFRSNVELKTLQLDGNHIQKLDAKLLHFMPHLLLLNLSGNVLDTIDKNTFDQNHNLHTLDLSDNRLDDIRPDWANGLEKLEKLYLNYNHLASLTFLESLVHLKTLQLSGNRLENIPIGTFDKLIDLQELSLAKNQIAFLEDSVFARLHLLRSIDVSHNDLGTAQFLQPLHKLRYLSMAYNQFETINLTLFFQFHNVELIGNPWSCTWLIEEMINAAEGIHFGRNYAIDGRDAKHSALTVPGIDCTDESGKRRNIVVLQMPAHERNAYKETIDEKPLNTDVAQQNKNIRKMLNDEFDYKACLIWVAIAVIAVFGIVHLGKVLFNRSEMNSEKYRLSQQVSLLPTIETTLSIPAPSKSQQQQSPSMSSPRSPPAIIVRSKEQSQMISRN